MRQTYVFRRDELERLDLQLIAASDDYVSRSGRKPLGTPASRKPDEIPLQKVANQLGMKMQRARRLLKMKLLKRVPSTGRTVLITAESLERCKKLYSEPLIPEVDAAARFGQTALQFRRTWVDHRIVKPVALVGKRGFREGDLQAIAKVLEGGTLVSQWARENGYSKGHARNRLRDQWADRKMSNAERRPFLVTAEVIPVLTDTKVFKKDFIVRPI